MKIILDTNILVSAFVFGGEIKKKLEYILADNTIHLLTSKVIVEELREVVFRDKFKVFQDEKFLTLQLNAFLSNVIIVIITQNFDNCRDKKDNKFLDLAVSGQADFLITGDKDLLELNPFHGVQILTLTDFIDLHYHTRLS
jgi:putative PIN family toxin of toxin-antitoxin system